ncbi:CHY_zinc finger domain-containing protein [Hexamita inflata]|uniref:CHY_zinc finger domain-containing protein n=1 Tax=Hexamita inflata TaxID=28002 RepID=A0ABP1KIN8_9EUKA
MDHLLKEIKELNENIKEITSGPLFNPKCKTVKILFPAPYESRIDLPQFSLVIAYNTDKNKFKFAFAVKDAQQQFLIDITKTFEDMKMPVPNRILWISDNYDQFLLKNYQWFERYQTIDEEGSTTMRYLLRQIPAFVARQEEKKKEEKMKEQIKEQQIKKDETYDEQIEREITNAQSKPEKIQLAPNQLMTSVGVVQINQKQAPQFELKQSLINQNEFKTLDQWEAEKQQNKLSQQNFFSNSIPLPEQQQQNEPKINKIQLHSTQKQIWTDENAKTYQIIIKGLQKNSLTYELLLLNHFFQTNSFVFTSISKENVVVQFDYSFTLLKDFNINSLHLKLLQEYIKQDNSISFLINFNLNKPLQSFIRVDPQGDICSNLVQFSRKLSQKPEMTHQDVTDRSFLSFCSRLLTQLMRYQSERQTEQAEEIQTTTFNTEIFQPKSRFVTCAQPKIIQKLLTNEEIQELIDKLPEPLAQTPVNMQQHCPVFEFITQKMPYLMVDVFARAAEQVFEDRVQAYLENEGYAETSSSSSEESDYEDDGEEGDEFEPSESSESSIYDSYGLIKNEFLHEVESNTNSIKLRLMEFDLSGGLLMQFTRPIISIICTKCLKMMPLNLQPETAKDDQGSFVETNQLQGISTCQNCNCKVELHLASIIFNQFTQGQCLYMTKHVNCLPVNIGYFSECTLLIQCAACSSLGLQTGLKEYNGQNKYSCRCPMCFKRISFSFSDSYFLLPNGEQLPLPKGIQKQQKAKVISHSGPLPNQGVCEHAKRSFRWFRFACGGAYPCDTCHDKSCQCGDKYAKTMLCGFCGRSQAVSNTCQHCKQCLINKKTSHWEGGKGNRNMTTLDRKDNHKFAGLGKVKSNKMKKRLAMQKRGNQKKKEGDKY